MRFLILIMAVLIVSDCTETDTTTNVENNYDASSGGIILVVDDGGYVGCFSADNNGSECTISEYNEASEAVIQGY